MWGGSMNNSLERFVLAQRDSYPVALQEVKNGMKTSHWMWYIFPQISGLGHSSLSTYYAISDLDEARAYLSDIVLGNRLKEISNELLKLETNEPVLVFGKIDSLKLNSSMTLFDYVSDGEDIFQKVIDKFYDGRKDELTLNICKNMTGKSYYKNRNN